MTEKATIPSEPVARRSAYLAGTVVVLAPLLQSALVFGSPTTEGLSIESLVVIPNVTSPLVGDENEGARPTRGGATKPRSLVCGAAVGGLH